MPACPGGIMGKFVSGSAKPLGQRVYEFSVAIESTKLIPRKMAWICSVTNAI